MSPANPIAAIACLLSAVASAFLLVKWYGNPPAEGRYASIDGLRGYLAFFVFIHHSCIWYSYMHTGEWKLPGTGMTKVYTHLGSSSVLLFFMITGFLFFSKLIEGRYKRIDWERLYVSRFLRLVPLYLFALLVMFLLVAALSRGVCHDSLSKMSRDLMRWLTFTILGAPNINQFPHTEFILAGAVWSLTYEWFFYLLLPLLALVVGIIPPRSYLLLAAAGVLMLFALKWAGNSTGLALWKPDFFKFLPFCGGMAAALLVRSGRMLAIAKSRACSFIILCCLAEVVTFETAFELMPILLLSVVFALIACGNDMFGLLTHSVSRTLGEMSYSIYLLHGIVLFITYRVILGPEMSRTLSPVSHWLVAVAIAPVVVFGSFITFRLIERPAMSKVSDVTAWIRGRARVFAVGPVVNPTTVDALSQERK